MLTSEDMDTPLENVLASSCPSSDYHRWRPPTEDGYISRGLHPNLSALRRVS
jgi:hypothetical protein